MFGNAMFQEKHQRGANRLGYAFDVPDHADVSWRSRSRTGSAPSSEDDMAWDCRRYMRRPTMPQQPQAKSPTGNVNLSRTFFGRAAEQTLAPAANAAGNECADDEAAQTVGLTTLMIRNLPPNISQSQLAREIDESQFAGLYDFLYMPTHLETGQGQGYAFVNFIESDVATRFSRAWIDTRLFGVDDGPTLHISFAYVQGRDANIEAWLARNTKRIRNPQLRPLVMQGRRRTLQPWEPPNGEQFRSKRKGAAPGTPPRKAQQSGGASSGKKAEATGQSKMQREAFAYANRNQGTPPRNVQPSITQVPQYASHCPAGQLNRHTLQHPVYTIRPPTPVAYETHAVMSTQPAIAPAQRLHGNDRREQPEYSEQHANYNRAPMRGSWNSGPVVKLHFKGGDLQLVFE